MQCGAAIEGFFWPKIFWDIFSHSLDGAVKPVPVLQIINLLLGLFTLAFEYPLGIFTNLSVHRSIVARLVYIPLSAGTVALLYQGPDSAGYHIIALLAYFWAYTEGEVRPKRFRSERVNANVHFQTICPVPWTLPKKASTGKVVV